MTRNELRERLIEGKTLEEVLPLQPGQECEIFKADEFDPGDNIIYIPDVSLNEIPVSSRLTDLEEIGEVLSYCYTGKDFLDGCNGDAVLAERLFWYCDWQHPSSAACEIEDEEDEI